MGEFEKSKLLGTFTISPGRDIYGELALAGSKTSLYVWDKEFFAPVHSQARLITGILHDLRKVTLIDCIGSQGGSHGRKSEKKFERNYNANIFPHYVILGNYHFNPADKTISSVRFVIDDATSLFYDFDAFGRVIDARPLIEQVVQSSGLDRKVETGPWPQIVYYTGKTEIFSAKTILGKVSASHAPSLDSGGPHGVSIDNTIFVDLHFEKTITFHEAMQNTFTLQNYFGILTGRPQKIIELMFHDESAENEWDFLQVYCSMLQEQVFSQEVRKPHQADVLLNGGLQPEAFASVLVRWLERQETWNDARARHFDSFSKQNSYDVDRLIGAANMFDILPDSATPKDVQLSKELKCAIKLSRRTFKNLPSSPERDSVLNALGRVGKSNLKQKIRHRAELLIAEESVWLSELATVTDEAVNCRNHYVHGGASRFDYSKNMGTVIFFIDTLEFVFATSDLIEAGWDIKAWSEVGGGLSHRYSAYLSAYSMNLSVLKTLLSRPAPTA